MGDSADFDTPRRGVDAARHYVRVTRRDHRGYTEFQYAIGDPTLSLDMILPPAAFAEFCARHRVVMLDAHTGAEVAHVD